MTNRHSTDDPQSLRLQRAMRLTLWFAGIYAAALPLAYWFWFSYLHQVPASTEKPDTWGAFGDFVGGLLNPVVAFFALYWLTRSIAIQREELRDSKVALQSANESQKQQAATLEKQRFEDTFFALLDQHNKVLDSLNHKDPVEHAISEMGVIYGLTFRHSERTLREASIEFKKTDDASGHYFRILYQILKLTALRSPNTNLTSEFSATAILGSQPSADEKLYSNIIRSFLSTRVTQLLAVNCFAENETSTYWNYKCLVERYALLEHMPFEVGGQVHPALRETHSYYAASAFGKSEFLSQIKD